ncbi:MAG TPA: helix-turn-helix transcriptional regulator [Gemmataceae bacterium]|nr:helix-turn-helix transcriptional regulator [Gemmataceae bacterium]
MAFGSRLKELREQAGLTQGELAAKAEMSQAGISDLEQSRGGRKPKWQTVQKLAVALGVSIEVFSEPAKSEEKTPRGRPRKSTSSDETARTPAKSKRRKGI